MNLKEQYFKSANYFLGEELKEILNESKVLDILKNIIKNIPFIKNVIDLSNPKKTIETLLQKVGKMTPEEYNKSLELAQKLLKNPNNPDFKKELQSSNIKKESLFSGMRSIQKGIFGAILIIMVAGQVAQPLAGTLKDFFKQHSQVEHNIKPDSGIQDHFDSKEDVKKFVLDGGKLPDNINIGGTDYDVGIGHSTDKAMAKDKAEFNHTSDNDTYLFMTQSKNGTFNAYAINPTH